MSKPFFIEKKPQHEFLELPGDLIFKIENAYDYFTGKTCLRFRFGETTELNHFFKRRGAKKIILHQKIAGTDVSTKIELIAELLSYNTDSKTFYILI